MKAKITLNSAIAHANTGADAIKKAPIVSEDTGIRCLRIGDLSNKRNYKDWGFSTVEDRYYETFRLQKGDIFVARTGNTIGVNMIIRFDNLKSVFNNGLIRLRVDKINFNPLFIFYIVSSKKMQSYIQSIAYGTSTQPNMKINDLLRFEFVGLKLAEQNKIAYILSTIDDKIELNRKMNQTLEEMAQTLYKSWFVDFDPIHAKANASNDAAYDKIAKELGISQEILDLFPDEFEESELGMIPKGWNVGNLGESTFSEIIGSGIDEFVDEKVYLATADVKDTNITNKDTLITYENRASRANMQPINNSIWFAKMLSSRKLLMFDRNTMEISKYVLSTGFAGIKTTKLSHYFIWTFILSNTFNNLKDNLANGAVQVAINNANIKLIQYIKPEEFVLEAFNVISQSLFSKKQQNDLEIETLQKTRETLQPKLLSGELDVSELELDHVTH